MVLNLDTLLFILNEKGLVKIFTYVLQPKYFQAYPPNKNYC